MIMWLAAKQLEPCYWDSIPTRYHLAPTGPAERLLSASLILDNRPLSGFGHPENNLSMLVKKKVPSEKGLLTLCLLDLGDLFNYGPSFLPAVLRCLGIPASRHQLFLSPWQWCQLAIGHFLGRERERELQTHQGFGVVSLICKALADIKLKCITHLPDRVSLIFLFYFKDYSIP